MLYSRAIIAAALIFLSGSITALANPTVELVVSTTPGGSQDLATRELQKALTSVDSSRDYVVVYKPGAAGAIAYNYAVKSNTPALIMMASGTFSEVSLNKTMAEIEKEATLIGPVWKSPGVLATGAKSGINSLDDLIRRGQQKRITCGAASKAIKLALDDFMIHSKMKDAEVILYKGTQEGMTGLINGDLDCWLDGLNGPLDALSQSGKLKIIASSENRAPQTLPNLPTMKSRLPADSSFYYSWWLTIGVPECKDDQFCKEIVPVLHRAIKTLKSTETLKIQQPDQYNRQFFVNWANFIQKISKDTKSQ
jgi:tripartite-type tricarboxylate transporter receptor subunit TctC